MSNIYKAFENKKAFIPFVTGGDPDLETTKNLLIAMEKAGADLIEIGIPFSDPIAEGPVIQEASQRALAAGCTTDKLFDMVKEARQRVKVPMVFMTYINPVYTYGKERFMKRCVECGIDGIIVPDLPYEEKAAEVGMDGLILPDVPFEEKEEFDVVCKQYALDLISLIAPTSHERIRMIAKEAKGFVYCVSSLGVTGVRSEIKTDVAKMVEMVKEVNDIPAAIGFGISTPEQAKKMASVSDGAIVGSAIVKIVAKYGKECIPEKFRPEEPVLYRPSDGR